MYIIIIIIKSTDSPTNLVFQPVHHISSPAPDKTDLSPVSSLTWDGEMKKWVLLLLLSVVRPGRRGSGGAPPMSCERSLWGRNEQRWTSKLAWPCCERMNECIIIYNAHIKLPWKDVMHVHNVHSTGVLWGGGGGGNQKYTHTKRTFTFRHSTEKERVSKQQQ